MERHASAGPVADGDEVRAVGLRDGQQLVAVDHAESRRLVGQAGQPFQLGHGDASQVEGALGAFGQPNHDEAKAVLAGLVVLLDQAPFLERGEQPRRGRLVESQPPG